MTEPTALAGLCVIELSVGHAAAVAGLLLAEAGATVLRIAEPQRPSALDDAQAAIWHRSKQVRALDLQQPADRAAFESLLDRCHLLLGDRTPAQAQADGLDAGTLAERWPALHAVNVGGWPAGHPLQERPVDDLLVLAEAGILDEQLAGGRSGPVYPRLPIGSWQAGLLAAVGALAALRGQPGTRVDTSLLQGAMVPLLMYWNRAERPTPVMTRGMPKENPSTVMRCADGLWLHLMPDPNKCPEIRQALADMPADERERANARYADVAISWFPNLGAIEQVIRQRPRDEWLRLLWAADVPVDAVEPLGALYRDEQAQLNGYVAAVDTPAFGPTLQPAVPITLQPPMQIGVPAGQGAFGQPARPQPLQATRRTPELPLHGLKVLDAGNYVAGPLGPMLMADLGAEVIKLEAATGDPLRPADWAFNSCQRGKRAVAVDLKQPAAHEIVLRLVEWADVVHHNLRLPAALKLGLGADELLAFKPSLVYAHVSAYGPLGPRRHWPGYDQLFQAASGWEQACAGQGQPPLWYRFGMMDHMAALMSVVGVLAALQVRDRTGRGQAISTSLLGSSLFTMDAPAAPDGRWLGSRTLDADGLGTSPLHRLCACADGWIAVAARPGDATALARWAQACGTTAEGIDAHLAARSCADALATLARCGLPAVRAIQAQRDAFLDDRGHQDGGWAVSLPHAVFGELAMPGALWSVDGRAACARQAPPRLGEHSGEVLRELGFGPERIAGWLASGLVKAL